MTSPAITRLTDQLIAELEALCAAQVRERALAAIESTGTAAERNREAALEAAAAALERRAAFKVVRHG